MLLALLLSCASPEPGAPPLVEDTGTLATTPPCADDELLDGETCVPEACGTGTWGEVEGTLYVDAAAAEGGSGTREAPFADLAAAVAASVPGDVVALAAGTYPVNLELGAHDLELVGRCAELVVLDGSGGTDDQPTLGINWVDFQELYVQVGLRGLTVTGGPYGGLICLACELELRDTVFQGNTAFDLAALYSSEVRIEDALFADVLTTGPPDYGFGYGLVLESNAHLEARRVRIERTASRSISLTESTALLEEVELVESGWNEGVEEPSALRLQDGADVSVVDLRLVDPRGWGVEVVGSTLHIAGLSVEGQQRVHHEHMNPALAVYEGGLVTGRGLDIRAGQGGVVAYGEGATASLSEVSLVDIDNHDMWGVVRAGSGGSLELDGVELRGLQGVALMAYEGASLTARSVEVAEMREGSDELKPGVVYDDFAHAAIVSDDSQLVLEDATLVGFSGVGVAAFASHLGTPTLSLTDVRLEQVGPAAMVRSAIGIYLLGGTLEAHGLEVVDVAGPGLVASRAQGGHANDVRCTDCSFQQVALAGVVAVGEEAGTTLTLDGCTVGDVALEESSGLSVGLLVTELTGPPTVAVTDCEVSGVAHAALAVVGTASVQVQDSTLHGGSGATVGGQAVHGNAVYASEGTAPWDGESGLLLSGNRLVSGLGDTVLLHGASATLDGNSWEGEAAGLRQQGCAGVAPVEGAEEAPAFTECPATDLLVVGIDRAPVDTPPVEL